VGAQVPAKRVSSREVVERCAHQPDIDLHGVTGIQERGVCAPDEDSLTLSVNAARDCLAHSKVEAQDLELIVFCGIAKYDDGLHHLRFEPSFSLLIREALGATSAMTFDIANACAGMMTGVHVVNDFVRRGVIRRGMVVSGEFITHLCTNASKVVDGAQHLQTASLTVGDAGAAVILERAEGEERGIEASVFTTQAEHVELCTGKPCPTGPGGFMVTQAREIHQAGIGGTPFIVKRVLDEAGLGFDAIDHVIMHQTAVRAIEKCSALVNGAFGSDHPAWMVNVDKVGNTASTSHFVALRRCLEERRFRPGEKIMLITQASGLVLGAVVFTMDSLGDRYGHQD
jgi:3-oxoacyl-[acyl-carrier-protein] synthase-3